MKKALLTPVVFLTALLSVTSEPIGEVLSDIINHLEFLDYSVEELDTDFYKVTGPARKPDFWLENLSGLVWINTNYSPDKQLPETDALAILNDLNAVAYVARYYMDEDGIIWVEATLPPQYDRQSFNLFLDWWESEALADLAATDFF